MRIPPNLHSEVQSIVDQPLTRSLMAVGPPGSGKSTVALFRVASAANRARRSGKSCISYFLTFNKTLVSDLNDGLRRAPGSQGTEEKSMVQVRTFHSFLGSLCRTIHWDRTGQGYDPDWDEARRRLCSQEALERLNLSARFRQCSLFIDEGQDMPPDFYLIVRRLADKLGWTVNVFADDNQAQRDAGQCSTVDEIRDALEFADPDVFRLKHNHRNSFRIALFARRFYVPGIETGWTLLPVPTPSNPVEVVRARSSEIVAARIVTEAQNRLNGTIGVLCPNDEVRRCYERLIRGEVGNRGIGVQVQTYTYIDNNSLPDFQKSGIYVLNFQSSKGLEFDSVHVVALHKYDLSQRTPERNMMQLYILATRARDKLTLSYMTADRPEVIRTLVCPSDDGGRLAYNDVHPDAVRACVREDRWI